MIIIGYQGIGKSTLASRPNNYVDLESGNFLIGGKRTDDWYIPYCNIAANLSDQGFDVFVSSHDVVRTYLKSLTGNRDMAIVFPALSLRDKWVEKLKIRYQRTGNEKDYRAFANASNYFVKSIKELSSDKQFTRIQITDMDYDLESMLRMLHHHLQTSASSGDSKNLFDILSDATSAILHLSATTSDDLSMCYTCKYAFDKDGCERAKASNPNCWEWCRS